MCCPPLKICPQSKCLSTRNTAALCVTQQALPRRAAAALESNYGTRGSIAPRSRWHADRPHGACGLAHPPSCHRAARV
eukprot:313668-Rhodomonas_salina.3